jgi:hypothetical protein
MTIAEQSVIEQRSAPISLPALAFIISSSYNLTIFANVCSPEHRSGLIQTEARHLAEAFARARKGLTTLGEKKTGDQLQSQIFGTERVLEKLSEQDQAHGTNSVELAQRIMDDANAENALPNEGQQELARRILQYEVELV